MVVHLDAGCDHEDRPREVCIVLDEEAKVLAIQSPVVAPMNVPWTDPIETTVRNYHKLRREAQHGNPRIEERGNGRWRELEKPLHASLGEIMERRR